MEFKESERLYKRSAKVLAGGVSSHFRAFGKPCPMFFDRASGSRIWDVDGNEYLDYALSQGPMILGHSPAEVLEAVQQELSRGQLYAGQHVGEIELAELFHKLVPCAELTRFSLTGSEATLTALRLARAATGRTKFVKFEGHYHGWYDSVLVSVNPGEDEQGPRSAPNAVGLTQGQSRSALKEVIVLPWNDIDLLARTVRRRAKEIAAIIMEPIMCNSGCIPPRDGFLEAVRELCDETGIVLIFDEVITGFRCALGGAQALLGITPDLATFGKALAAGFPISAIAGRGELMDLIANGTVMHAGTFNTYNAGVAASLATIRRMKANRNEVHRRLRRLGQRLMAGIRRAARRYGKPVLIQGPGPMFHVGFTDRDAVHDYRGCQSYDVPRYGLFVQAMRELGVRLIGRGIWYVSAAHTEDDIDDTLERLERVLREA